MEWECQLVEGLVLPAGPMVMTGPCHGFCGNSMTKCQLYQQAAWSFRYLVSNLDQATVLGSPTQMVPMRIMPTLLIGLNEISLGLLKDPKLSTLIVPNSYVITLRGGCMHEMKW